MTIVTVNPEIPAWDDLMSSRFWADPYPLYDELRQQDPVHWNQFHRAWVLTRYDDVHAAFRNPRLSSDRIGPVLEKARNRGDGADTRVFEVLRNWMVFNDPPAHTRLRSAVAGTFTAPAAKALENEIRRLVEEQLDEFERKADSDLIDGFCYPLPSTIIAELLGVPVEDRDRFRAWSDDLGLVVFGTGSSPARHARAERSLFELIDYFRSLFARYHRHPGDNLISQMLTWQAELSEPERVATCILLLFAGHETTTTMLGAAVIALLDHPDQLALWRHRPEVARTGVEELLRFDGPAKMTVRSVVEDFELRGRELRAGQRVFLAQGAANRDPAQFPEPHRLDLTRAPNPHLGFGHGIHFCLGGALARVETRLAVTALLARFPSLRLATEQPAWRPSLLGRGMKELRVEY